MSETKFGPQIGGSMKVYQQIRAMDLKVGQKVRVSVPGWPDRFVTEIVDFGDSQPDITSAPRVAIGDQRYFLADRANGHPSPGHDWLLEFEITEPVLPNEFGLYQIADGRTKIEHEITYRHSNIGGWANALDNAPLSERQLELLSKAYIEGNLFRLGRFSVVAG